MLSFRKGHHKHYPLKIQGEIAPALSNGSTSVFMATAVSRHEQICKIGCWGTEENPRSSATATFVPARPKQLGSHLHPPYSFSPHWGGKEKQKASEHPTGPTSWSNLLISILYNSWWQKWWCCKYLLKYQPKHLHWVPRNHLFHSNWLHGDLLAPTQFPSALLSSCSPIFWSLLVCMSSYACTTLVEEQTWWWKMLVCRGPYSAFFWSPFICCLSFLGCLSRHQTDFMLLTPWPSESSALETWNKVNREFTQTLPKPGRAVWQTATLTVTPIPSPPPACE